MSDWRVAYSSEAEQDLQDIYTYITYTLLAPDEAIAQTERIMDAVDALDHMPMRHPIYPHEPWKSVGLRLIPVDNYLVFYTIDEHQGMVNIVRIAYGARSIPDLLSGN